MNTVTYTNLDYKLFDQYMEDARFLGLSLVSFNVLTSGLTLVLNGEPSMTLAFKKWLDNPNNWTNESIANGRNVT